MKKVSIENLEADKAFMDILRNRTLSVRQTPRSSAVPDIEIDLSKLKKVDTGLEIFLKESLTQGEINLDEVDYESN